MRNVVMEKSFEFAVLIVKFVRELREAKQEQVLGNQLLRSGTSIGANINEAQQAQSRKDFISKMSIALKEAYETRYWLMLLERVDSAREEKYKVLLSSSNEIIKILVSIVKNSKEM